MTPFCKFVFCATDFYRATGIRYWIFLLHGCRTNQINIYSPKGVLVKPFCGTFLLWFIFCILWISFDTERNSKMDFPLAQVWSLSRSQRSPKISCIGNCIKKLWLRSANLYFAQRIFIGRPEFATGRYHPAACGQPAKRTKHKHGILWTLGLVRQIGRLLLSSNSKIRGCSLSQITGDTWR